MNLLLVVLRLLLGLRQSESQLQVALVPTDGSRASLAFAESQRHESQRHGEWYQFGTWVGQMRLRSTMSPWHSSGPMAGQGCTGHRLLARVNRNCVPRARRTLLE